MGELSSPSQVRRLRLRIGLGALAVVAVYVVAVGTAPGRHVDALLPRHDFGSGPAYRAAGQLLDAINWLTVGASGLAIALWALLRHRARCACWIVVGLAGTYASAVVLSLALEHTDPLGGEPRGLGAGFYPSGHAAAVAALALAAVAVAPRAWRPIVAVFTGVAVATVGVVIVVIHSHYPSDVVGGWLLAVAWMAPAMSRCRAASRPASTRSGVP